MSTLKLKHPTWERILSSRVLKSAMGDRDPYANEEGVIIDHRKLVVVETDPTPSYVEVSSEMHVGQHLHPEFVVKWRVERYDDFMVRLTVMEEKIVNDFWSDSEERRTDEG